MTTSTATITITITETDGQLSSEHWRHNIEPLLAVAIMMDICRDIVNEHRRQHVHEERQGVDEQQAKG